MNKPGIPTTDWDWIIYPEGLFDLLVYIKQRYPNYKQIFITENGMGYKDPYKDGFVDDQPRIDYIEQHLRWLLKAMEVGVNVGGYFLWSCRISSPGPMATTSVMASSTLTLKPRSARPRQAPTGTSTWRRPVVWTSGLRGCLPHNLSPFLSRGRHVTRRAAPAFLGRPYRTFVSICNI